MNHVVVALLLAYVAWAMFLFTFLAGLVAGAVAVTWCRRHRSGRWPLPRRRVPAADLERMWRRPAVVPPHERGR